jgi:hypothetical protein
MILLLSEPKDQHAAHVASMLQRRRAKFIQFDPARFPREAEICVASSKTKSGMLLRFDGSQIDLDSVGAAWYRRPEKPVAHDAIVDSDARRLIEQECHQIMHDLWASLDCAWLPASPLAIRQAEFKGAQLKVARDLGFIVPPTLMTNSPGDLLEFYRQHEGRIVSKQAAKGFLDVMGQTFVRYTELVTTRDIAHAQSVRYCPMTFQAYVDKQLEIRATVVGDRVFTAEIHSQTTNHTRYDWRRYDHGQTPHFAHSLPSQIELQCVQLVKKLGLCYGAIDMVLTPDGRYVFLEINPNGQYLWLEDEAELPISESICDFLMAASEEATSSCGASSIGDDQHGR